MSRLDPVLSDSELSDSRSTEEYELSYEEQIENNVEECSVCYERISGRNNCNLLCGHLLCIHCLLEITKNECPICRRPLKSDVIKLEKYIDFIKFRNNKRLDEHDITMRNHHSEFHYETERMEEHIALHCDGPINTLGLALIIFGVFFFFYIILLITGTN